MRRVVLDTNILVSALLCPDGNPDKVVRQVLSGKATIVYNGAIMGEYIQVLYRPRFDFDEDSIARLLAFFHNRGYSITAEPSIMPFLDESDRKFYDLAVASQAFLVTGNRKHFPDKPFVVSPAEFLKMR